jgi:hypothetical protein
MDGEVLAEQSSVVFSQALPGLNNAGNALSDTAIPGISDITLERNASLAYTVSPADVSPLSDLAAGGNDPAASLMDDDALKQKASLAFPAMQPDKSIIPGFTPAENQQQKGSYTFHIQNVNVQADDFQSLLDFVRMLMQAVHRPEEMPV